MESESESEFSEGFQIDQGLLNDHRNGDPSAFGELYLKHRERGLRYARTFTQRPDQAEDLLNEAFTRILGAIARGNGPTVSLEHYLASTIRNVAISQASRELKEFPHGPEEIAELIDKSHGAEVEGSAAIWLTDPFNRLDRRAQQIVWFRIVEGQPSKVVAASLNLSPVAATRLYKSAISQMRVWFVDESVGSAPTEDCRELIPAFHRLARSSGRTLPVLKDRALQAHVQNCSHCMLVKQRLGSSDHALMSVVFIAGAAGMVTPAWMAAPPANASSLIGALALPAKAAVISVPVAGLSVAVGAFVLAAPAPQPVELGEAPADIPAAIASVGDCELNRLGLDDGSEVWRATLQSGNCDVRIEWAGPDDSGKHATTIVDTLKTPEIRAVEISRPGSYQITITDGTKESRASVIVK